MISFYLNKFLIGMLFIDMIERRFPEELKNFMVSLSYNVIYIYSKAQILFMKYNKKINEFIESNPSLLKIKNDFNLLIQSTKYRVNKLEFIKNGNLIENKSTDYDFAIYSDLKINTICENKKIFQNNEQLTEDYEISNIQFMLIELLVGEKKTFKITLKNEKYNFYIVENMLSKDFFTYYLKNIHDDKFDLTEESIKEDKITIKIIDHDVNKIEFDLTDKNEYIIIEKTSYKLNIINHQENNEQ
jgi:hypothetical protein